MEPIQLGALTIYPFGLFTVILLIPFFLLAAWSMKKSGLKKETASWFAVLAVPLCFILSRFGFCLLNMDQIFGYSDFGMFFRVTEGGCLLWGAIAGVLLSAKIAGKITGQSGAVISDSAVVPVCLMIAALRLLCGLLFKNIGIGMALESWFDPEEADFASRFSVWRLEDYSFFERFPFAVQDYYEVWSWAVFVLQALWAGITAFLVRRPASVPGGKTTRFLILYSCGSLLLECMLFSGEILHLPWNGFVKANELLCAIALVTVLIICLRRIGAGWWKKTALIFLPQFLCAIGVIIVMEFAAFEKKIPEIDWLPADACHLLVALACLWIALAFRPVWKKAYERSPL